MLLVDSCSWELATESILSFSGKHILSSYAYTVYTVQIYA